MNPKTNNPPYQEDTMVMAPGWALMPEIKSAPRTTTDKVNGNVDLVDSNYHLDRKVPQRPEPSVEQVEIAMYYGVSVSDLQKVAF